MLVKNHKFAKKKEETNISENFIYVDIDDNNNNNICLVYNIPKFVKQRCPQINHYIENVKMIFDLFFSHKTPFTTNDIVEQYVLQTGWKKSTFYKYVAHIINMYDDLFIKNGKMYTLNIKKINSIQLYSTSSIIKDNSKIVNEDYKMINAGKHNFTNICFIIADPTTQITFKRIYNMPSTFMYNKQISIDEYFILLKQIINVLTLDYQIYYEIENKIKYNVEKHQASLYAFLRHVCAYYPEIFSRYYTHSRGLFKLNVDIKEIHCVNLKQKIISPISDFINVSQKNTLVNNNENIINNIDDDKDNIMLLTLYLIKEFENKQKEKLIACKEWYAVKNAVKKFYDKKVL